MNHILSPASWRRVLLSTGVVLLTSCQTSPTDLHKPEIDLGPLDCGYKWFQTGRSPRVPTICEQPRTPAFKAQQEQLAAQQAWEIARVRCPTACPPRELRDPSGWEDNYPNGVCGTKGVFYHARVFFQCQASPPKNQTEKQTDR